MQVVTTSLLACGWSVYWFSFTSSLCSFIYPGSTASGQNETINWTVAVEVLMLLYSFTPGFTSVLLALNHLCRRHSVGISPVEFINLFFLSLALPLWMLQYASNKVLHGILLIAPEASFLMAVIYPRHTN